MRNWPALPEHDWDTHPRTDELLDVDNTGTFKIIHGANHPVHKPARTPKDDGVRLDTPDTHRAKALTTIHSRSRQALLEADSMRQWMISIGYYKEAVSLATEAVSSLEAVSKFLEIHEGSE